MLHDGRMSGLVKLHRSAQPRSERQVRAVRVEVTTQALTSAGDGVQGQLRGGEIE